MHIIYNSLDHNDYTELQTFEEQETNQYDVRLWDDFEQTCAWIRENLTAQEHFNHKKRFLPIKAYHG